MFFEPFTKGSGSFSYILLITLHPITLVSINDAIFLSDQISVFGCHQEVFDGFASRTFGERFKEHLKHPSPIYDHNTITGHDTTIDNFSIVGREDNNLMRLIKEAIYIRVNNPSLKKILASTICLMCGMRF